ncbi:M24 family metallopeptidase [Ancylobacter amanitiformis]|uniref:Xaa-Pro dipeptidase n=1 Tax=Ancylobacter amanitiformis TaxID=217069 RepID=A0ABU0LQK6_9HYPH|nr:Xaa-Pro peptidase family protein [Ancylobacter amanitiformis]MDQ0510959.1 Xaa-Pro dipeptidase [Ancylobacter amanitiformis]
MDLTRNLRFSAVEYARRLAVIKNSMAKQGIEVLCDGDPANMYYATGFDAMSFFTPQLMVIALDAPEPIIITRKMDTRAVRRTAYIGDDSIHGWPEIMCQHLTFNPMTYAAEVIRARGWDTRSIGIEMDAWMFTPRDCEVLRAHLPNARIRDARLLINWARTVKSAPEIAYMREAGKIQERIMRTAIDTARPGVRECDLAAEIYRAQLRGTEEFGGDYSAYHASIPTGDKAGNPHLSWTDQRLENDQSFTMELGAVRHRYHTPMARTVYLGRSVPQTLVDTSKHVIDGFEETISRIRPGMTCHEANEFWERYNRDFNLEKDSRIAYAIGCCYPPVWQEKTVSIRAGEPVILEENMTFHMILGIFHDNWGYSMSESIRIGADGVEVFANFPRELFVLN